MKWKSLDTGKKHSQVLSLQKKIKMILFFSIFKEDSNLLQFLKIQNTTKKNFKNGRIMKMQNFNRFLYAELHPQQILNLNNFPVTLEKC